MLSELCSPLNTTISTTIQCHEMQLFDRWRLEGATNTVEQTPFRNTLLCQIAQHQDGMVELRFNRPPRMPPRHSFEVTNSSVAFRQLNIEEESGVKTQRTYFKISRAVFNSYHIQNQFTRDR